MRRLGTMVLALFLTACGQQPQPPQIIPEESAQTLAASDPQISEIRIDHPGSDNDEYVELTGEPGTSLDNLTYLVIGDRSAGSGVVEAVVSLDGYSIPSSGYFVIAESTFTLGTADLTTSLNFENDDNVTHLLVNGFSGSNSDDLDTNDDGELDATPPWVRVLDLVALVKQENPPMGEDDEFHYGPPRVGPDGSFVPGHVYRCDGEWQIGPFNPGDGFDSPGAANCSDQGSEGPAVGQCDDPATLISAVQGPGDANSMVGQSVLVEGVVVGDFQEDDGDEFGTDLDGFYVQEEDADQDEDSNTSEGVFVFARGAADVQEGDKVRIAGTVTEFEGLTEISLTELLTCGPVPLPSVTDIELPLSNNGDLERFEGMLVRLPQELVISEYFNFDRFGEIVLALPLNGLDRPFQPTSYVDPTAGAADVAEDIARSRITLDDARSGQNPHPARHPNGMEFIVSNTFRGGDLLQNTIGVLDYRFDLYRVQPTVGADYTPANPRPSEPENVGGQLRAASFNVLNYFTTLGSRGADTSAEFERQRDKIIAALTAIDADIVGLIEIENNSQAIQDLVVRLNAELGTGTYAYIDTGAIGTDEIKVAFIYKPSSVTPIGDYAVLEGDFLDPNNTGSPKNRPALAQTFERNGNGAKLTAVVNHFKSKGSSCELPGDDGPLVGSCNVTRTLAAGLLLDWLATDPTGASDPDYLLIGDYNAYDEEKPIERLKAGFDGVTGSSDDITDLLEASDGESAYTYVFDGQYGHLDYALATPSLSYQVTGTTAWHINADEPDILDYDMTFKPEEQFGLYQPTPYRSSDHDPIVVGLNMNSSPTCGDATANVSELWPANHRMTSAYIMEVTDPEGDPLTITVDAIYQDEPVLGSNDGNTSPDAVIEQGGSFKIRAERDGDGNGRYYHVTFTARDLYGSCTGQVQVSVPVSPSRNHQPVDDGPLYEATSQ